MNMPAIDLLVMLPAFALVLFRISGLVLTAPILGSPVIPLRIRVAFVFAMSVMVFPLVQSQLPAAPTLAEVVAGAIGELALGAVIGLALTTLLLAGEVAGTLIGQQAGLVLGEVANPLQDHQASVLGQIYTVVLTSIFLVAGGHRAMVASVLDTFSIIPAMALLDSTSSVVLLTEMLSAAFIAGIRLAGPAMIALFLSAITLAVLSRAMPQFNILTVGFTMKVIVALVVSWLAMSACEGMLLQLVVDGLDAVRSAFGLPQGRYRIVA